MGFVGYSMDIGPYNATIAFILFNIGLFYTATQLLLLPDEREDYEN